MIKPNAKQRAAAMALTAAIMTCAGTSQGQSQQELLDKIKSLEARVAELEEKGPAVAAAKGSPWESWIGSTKFSGFASASYLYNFNRTDTIYGRSFDVDHNEFSLNKLKLVFERPVDFSPDKWDVGFRSDLIFGEDASLIQSAGLNLGSQGDLEQLYVTVNVPVGRGLQVSAGKFVTLQGVEVIEEVANPNWSEGNQFLFVEAFTMTGVQLAYKLTDKIDTQFRVVNGWDVVKDNNNALSYMARVGFALDELTSIALVGYAGPEQTDASGNWRKGIELVASRKLTPALTAWVQADYGQEDDVSLLTGVDDAEWYAVGGWLSYAFNDKVGLAVRGDFLKDKDGARTSGFRFPANDGQDLTSWTATLNLTPIKNLQVRPEVRYDHSSDDLFANRHGGGKSSQVTAGIGVAYLF